MDVNARRIDVEPDEYVAALKVTEDSPAKLDEYDGATLIQVSDDHYLVLTCDQHDDHHGHRAYARLMPEGWVCFAQATSPDGWSAFHYGPED
jgi:hypothetical protein